MQCRLCGWCHQGSVIQRLWTRPRPIRQTVASVGVAGRRRRIVMGQLEQQSATAAQAKLPTKSQLEKEDAEEGKISGNEQKDPSPPPGPFLRLLAKFIHFCEAIWQLLTKLTLKRLLGTLLLIGTLFGCQQLVTYSQGQTINVIYSEFVKQVETGKVEAVYFESKTQDVQFKYTESMWNTLHEQFKREKTLSAEESQRLARRIQTTTKMVPGQMDSLTELLKKKQIKFGVKEQSAETMLRTFALTMFWLWVPLLPLIYMVLRTLDMRVGGRSRKVKNLTTTRMRFVDVAGMEEAKMELLEVVELLKDPGKYAKLNAKVPSGVLLCGPTGTGKTLLARAVSGEAGVPFFAVSASEFVEMFVGRGAARIRELFREARRHTPCVVFIDEIDSVGGLRGNSFNDERDQTLNQLLVELDGFEDNKSILLLAATNRFKSLDPALLRPGRLTRKISIPLPDAEGRAEILAVHLRDVPMKTTEEKVVACRAIGRLAIGFSGAELANAANEAALMAARENRDIVHIDDLLQGLRRTKNPVNTTATRLPSWLETWQQNALRSLQS